MLAEVGALLGSLECFCTVSQLAHGAGCGSLQVALLSRNQQIAMRAVKNTWSVDCWNSNWLFLGFMEAVIVGCGTFSTKKY